MSGTSGVRTLPNRDVASQLLAPSTHEVGAYLTYADDGFRPYYALLRALNRHDVGLEGDSHSVRFRSWGRMWVVTLTAQRSQFLPWEPTAVAADAGPAEWFPGDVVREPRLQVTAVSDSAAPSNISYHARPSSPDLQTPPSMADPSSPADRGDGLTVHAQGSNLPLDAYQALLPEAVRALGGPARLFRPGALHAHSSIYAAERYVRVRRRDARRVTSRSGPLAGIARHVHTHGNERGFEYRADDARGLVGYHHRTRFSGDAAGELLPGHSLGKCIKSYHSRDPSDDPDDPLHHPKLGVSLDREHDDRGSVPWDDRTDLQRELDEMLLSVLSWAGLPLTATDVYVADDHFSPEERRQRVAVVDDPTPALETEQESLAVRHVSANPGLTESDVAVLGELADSGRAHADTVADEAGYSRRTVYRVLSRLSGLLESDRGTLRFGSSFIREKVSALLSDARDLLEAAEQDEGDDGETSAWLAWCATYGVDVDDPGGTGWLSLRVSRTRGEDIRDVLQAGLRAWRARGEEARRFRGATVEYPDGVRQPALR
jgi:hypothetical protein